MDYKKISEDIINWLKEWFKDKKGPVIIGISGGKDSTICAALLTKALGKERVIGIMMPNGIQNDINDSIKVCNLLEIKSYTININNMYDSLNSEIIKNIKDPNIESSFEHSTITKPLYSKNTLLDVEWLYYME